MTQLEAFIRAQPAARWGVARKSLALPMTLNRALALPRHRHIEQLHDSGYRLQLAPEGRRLVAPDGTFYAESDLTKTALDYAAWLEAQS